ncbi:hypothetical protein H9L12_07875 [Sphingomonas rhizophila]|uniref:Uncharacterized protein n=1 Tax=Sphingomonas rhizophila TaxID=2071607 RepID=A0A7G9S8U9_9SPHN|nr:hypothetical protein [Sphingomonas rhizophila]QNN64274.1 hypothetical protein H9L12_07875 [Sphingomonas rhizophila]
MTKYSAGLIASVFALAPVGGAFADPGSMLTNVRPHQHYVLTPNGSRVEVGPNICDHPDLQYAFNQFHYNVHHSASAPGVDAETLGPQHGAPGLHDGQGGDMVVTACD